MENNRFRAEEHAPKAAEKREAQKPSQAPKASAQEAQRVQGAQGMPSGAKRLFLRVPDAHGAAYCKARNLAELFDGAFPTFFYYADEKRYETAPLGVALSDYVLRQFRALLGEENVIYCDTPSMGADDFAYFANAAKGCYFNIGTAEPGKPVQALHSECFAPNEECILTGLALVSGGVWKLMESAR